MWRQNFKCHDIKYCEYNNSVILNSYFAYNRMMIENINKFRRQLTQALHILNVKKQFKKKTKNWYNEFLLMWRKFSARCVYAKKNISVCENKKATNWFIQKKKYFIFFYILNVYWLYKFFMLNIQYDQNQNYDILSKLFDRTLIVWIYNIWTFFLFMKFNDVAKFARTLGKHRNIFNHVIRFDFIYV